LLGNKKALFYMLREYYRLTERDIFSVVPLTFHIRRGFQDEEFKTFSARFVQQRVIGAPNYWIIKPGEFSNRGQGISCTNRMEDVRSRISKVRNSRGKSLIVQQYITNPLLYNGRKFDIRAFMLLTVSNGRLRGYWYQEGYVRTSSYLWDLEDIADNDIHLTNDAIQKHCPNYGEYEAGNKLTYSELQRYLDTFARSNVQPPSLGRDICPRLKEIAEDAVRATFCHIDPQRRGSNFEIFGFDFMLDTNCRPWLIEINTNPCLEMSCPVLNRIIPSMLENAFRYSSPHLGSASTLFSPCPSTTPPPTSTAYPKTPSTTTSSSSSSTRNATALLFGSSTRTARW
jgi:tubulin polyglutamylase TTLL1